MSHLLWSGVKTFWKTKNYLEIGIFQFVEHSVYEIIAYDPVIQQHTNRLYIDAIEICSILNCIELSKYGTSRAVKNINELLITFIFNHIILTDYLPQSKLIQIDFIIYSNELKWAQDKLFVVERPVTLPLVTSPFQRYNN